MFFKKTDCPAGDRRLTRIRQIHPAEQSEDYYSVTKCYISMQSNCTPTTQPLVKRKYRYM